MKLPRTVSLGVAIAPVAGTAVALAQVSGAAPACRTRRRSPAAAVSPSQCRVRQTGVAKSED